MSSPNRPKVKRITDFARKQQARKAKIIKLRSKGFTLEAIADQTDVTAARVGQILRDHQAEQTAATSQ